MTTQYDADSTNVSGALSRLAAIGYGEAGVRERLGLEDLAELQMRALSIYRQERLQLRDPLATAIDLFLLQGTVPEAELEQLFAAPDRAALESAGILESSGAGVKGLISLYPVGRRLVFSDHAWPQLDKAGYSTVPHDQVMYVGTDSQWLARTTVRKPVASALDLCCGSGIHALLAAAHAGHVTAVDINPRAVRCTAFNAKAMGLDNLEVLQGDLYAPLGNRRFDLITANPPFVPAPAQEVGFRDGGPSGEEIQRRIVQGLPRHLAEGGMAQIVTELGEQDGQSLGDRLRTWLDGAPMDIHILRLRTNTAQVYAIGHADGDDPADFLASVGRWAANLQTQGYSHVVSVLLAFQWSSAPWTRVDEAHPPRREAGDEVSAIFHSERLARDLDLPDRLRTGKVVRTGPVTLLEARVLGSQVPPSTLARRAGLAMPVEHQLDSVELDLLCCLESPVVTADLLAVGAKTGVPEKVILDSLVSLVRKGLIKPQP